ncbi:hypothetical protein, partial [Escherichia coli]|uniref:hypothetical protein n=1 Tax=Escherichia coli TaxID=562 RepID=UPI001BC89166
KALGSMDGAIALGMAKGKLDLQAMVDSGAKPPKANLQGKVQGLQLSALFPEIELMKKSPGQHGWRHRPRHGQGQAGPAGHGGQRRQAAQ